MNEESRVPLTRRFSFHGSMPKWAYGFFSIPILAGLVMLGYFKQIPLIAPLWFILLPLIALTDRKREIDTANGIIRNRWKLFGIIPLWKTDEPVSSYEAVTCRRSDGSTTSPVEYEWIALVRPSGKFSYVRYFYARKKEICMGAQAAARLLSEATGLPIREYPDRHFNRRAPAGGANETFP